MMSPDTLPAKPHPSIHALASALLSFLFIVICFSGISPGQETRLQVVNKIRSLEITNIKRDGMEAKLTLRNFCDKTITAFEIYLPSPTGANGDPLYWYQEFEEVLPGDSYELTLPIPERRFNIGEPHHQDIVVTFVLFKNRTSEGDVERAAKLEAYRLGKKEQIARIIPLLQRTLESSDADLPAALQSLKEVILSLRKVIDPSSLDAEEVKTMDILRSNYSAVFDRMKDALTSEIRRGLYFGKGGFFVKIRDLQQQLIWDGRLSLRQKLTSILQECEKELAVL